MKKINIRLYNYRTKKILANDTFRTDENFHFKKGDRFSGFKILKVCGLRFENKEYFNLYVIDPNDDYGDLTPMIKNPLGIQAIIKLIAFSFWAFMFIICIFWCFVKYLSL